MTTTPEHAAYDASTDASAATTATGDLRALANTVRLDMLRLLRDRTWTMAELATELGLRKGSVSYHLRVLERADIVCKTSERSVRGGRQQLWGVTAPEIAGDPEGTEAGARPAVLRALSAQMERSNSQRLLVSQVRLDAEGQKAAVALLEHARASIRELETDNGDLVSLGAFAYSIPGPTSTE
ncbi:winged helix-turn-helix domain-containing protein [Rhodoglobus sp. NPDC076762]